MTRARSHELISSPLRSYKLTHDTGFAPNPFFGWLTLATCKPGIRRVTAPGEWVAGFTSRTLSGDAIGQERLVYLMKVAERLPIADYFHDRRFARKRPSSSRASQASRHGDNIYRPLRRDAVEASAFEQMRNAHHWDHSCDREDSKTKQRDLSGRNVLVAKEFVYFGQSALVIPRDVRPDVPDRQAGYGSLTTDADRAQAFIEFVLKHATRRIMGRPHGWPSDGKICTP